MPADESLGFENDGFKPMSGGLHRRLHSYSVKEMHSYNKQDMTIKKSQIALLVDKLIEES